MRIITAYQTSDGSIFTDDRKAKSHQEDIIGEMLDGLFPNDDRGNVTRADRYNILMKMIADPELKNKISNLNYALQHSNENDEDY